MGAREERNEGEKGERQKLRKIFLLFASQMPVIFGTGSVESRNQELHPSLPREWQEAKLYSHHLLPPRMCISRKPDQKQRLDFIPGSPKWYAGVPSSGLSHCAAISITDVIFLYTASYI